MQTQYGLDPVSGLLMNLMGSLLFDGGILYFIYRKYKFGIGFKFAFFILLSGFIPNTSATISQFFQSADTKLQVQFVFAFVNIAITIFTLFYVFKTIVNPLNLLVGATETIAQGNLNTELPDVKSNDETSRLKKAFENMNNFLKSIISELKSSTTIMTSSSKDLATSSEQVSASSEEISAITQRISQSTQEQNNKLNELVKGANELKITFDNKITEINMASTLIESISSQVNMLSLNASIEAARAGEYGRGFSVVAENIRKLADESKNSVNKVQTTIDSLNTELIKNLNNLINSIDSVAILANETASGSEEASAATEEQSETMEEITASTQQLANLSINLENILTTFTI